MGGIKGVRDYKANHLMESSVGDGRYGGEGGR